MNERLTDNMLRDYMNLDRILLNYDELAQMARELLSLRARVAELEAENARLLGCINDAYRLFGSDIVERVAERVEDTLSTYATVKTAFDEDSD